MKRFFLVMVALIALVAFPACKSCGKDQPNAKPTVTQTAPKGPEAKSPQTTLPEAMPPAPDTMRPKTVQPKTRRPKPVAPKVEPTPEPKTVVAPKPEPKPEPKIAAVPKAQPPKCAPKPQVSIVDYWLVPHPSGISRDMFAITFVVKNPTLKDVKVKVVCHYKEGPLFGESIPQTVDANSDAKLMVRGFRRCPSGAGCHESFDCRVVPVE